MGFFRVYAGAQGNVFKLGLESKPYLNPEEPTFVRTYIRKS